MSDELTQEAPAPYIPAILRPLWREAVERSIRTYLETEGICWVESAPPVPMDAR